MYVCMLMPQIVGGVVPAVRLNRRTWASIDVDKLGVTNHQGIAVTEADTSHTAANRCRQSSWNRSYAPLSVVGACRPFGTGSGAVNLVHLQHPVACRKEQAAVDPGLPFGCHQCVYEKAWVERQNEGRLFRHQSAQPACCADGELCLALIRKP